jgi:predicted dehydrogenase
MKTINAAVIGYGLAGRAFHAPIINCLEEFHLKAIYTKNKTSGEEIHRRYENTAVVTDVKDIFEDETIELVVIATPNEFHYPLAAEAIAANKNVVVDKPFTITSQDADQLIKLAQEKNTVLSVYQNRRWDSDFLTVKKLIESGMLGKLVEFESHFDRFKNTTNHNWREESGPGCGMLYDLGPHLIDQAVNLFGLPEAVTADLRNQRECKQTIDNFELILHYPNLKVTLKSGMLVKIPTPRFTLLGDRGSFVKYGLDVQEDDLVSELTPRNKSDWGKEPASIYGRISTEIGGLNMDGIVESERGDYRQYYLSVYKALVGEAPLAVTPQQARNTIKLIEEAIVSSDTKRTIDLKESFIS